MLKLPLSKPDQKFIDKALLFLMPFVRYFRTEITGSENLPKGASLIISNHAVWGIDVLIFLAAYYHQTGKIIRGLGEHLLFSNPFVGEGFRKCGAVDGTQENAVRLLKSGQAAICYPGGARDSFKNWRQRYQLLWEGRTGYLRSAVLANAPIVPMASLGVDDAYITIGREKIIGRWWMGKPKYDLPIFFGLGLLPFPVKFRFLFGKPIYPRQEFGLTLTDARANSQKLIKAHEKIQKRVQALIDANR